MKKFIQTIKNIFAIEELRKRIIHTLLLLLVFRFGSYVILPGVNSAGLATSFNDVRDFLNIFLGGAFQRASIFALGIMPYISASIVVQLLTIALPSFQKMQKEGDSGRKKINNITRLLTVVITLAQSSAYLATTVKPEAISPNISQTFFTISSMIILTAGTMFCMWLGERITDRGIGQGISMLIMIGIVSRFPAAIIQEGQTRGMNGALFFVLEIAALFFVVMGVVLLTQAVRRIPVQYAKQVVGNKVYGGQRQYIPLKVNAVGVMPIIFAQSLMFLPSILAGAFQNSSDTAGSISQTFSNPNSLIYNVVFALMIIIFTYFYTAISINPKQIADDMKRNNGFVPGVQPGEPTAEYIDNILSRVTLPGALFLALIAVLPAIVGSMGVTQGFAAFFGGTSLLIMVSVVLDTLQQIESYLLMKHYEGLMETGNLTEGEKATTAVV